MKFIQWVISYKFAIFILILLSYIVLNIAHSFSEMHNSIIFHVVISAVNIIYMMVMIFLMIYIDKKEKDRRAEDHVMKGAPFSYIFFNRTNSELIIPDNCIDLLNLSRDRIYSLNDIKSLFDGDEWRKIEKYVELGVHNQDISQIGLLTLIGDKVDRKYIRYIVHSISNDILDVYGFIIWFYDCTEFKSNELQIVPDFKKYRIISYELDLLFNSIDFPIWRKEADGELVFYNAAYQKLIPLDNDKKPNSEMNNFLNELTNLSMERKDKVTVRRIASIDGKAHALDFIESPALNNSGTIGYALFSDEIEFTQKRERALTDLVYNVLNLSNTATLILDNEQKVEFFNKAFSHLFEIEEDWLSTKPYYSLLLDKLRSKAKLPEFDDYKEFKEKKIDLICNLIEPNYEVIYLQDTQTFRVATIPVEEGKTVFRYDNITDVLGIERSYNELLSVYKETLENIQEPVITFSSDGRLKVCNKEFITFFKISEKCIAERLHFSVLIEEYYASLMIKKSWQKVSEYIIRAIQDRQSNSIDIELKNKKTLHIKVVSMPDNTAQMHHHLDN